MTQEARAAVVAAYQSDPAFKAALDGAGSLEETVRIANEHGYAVAIEDLQSADDELSDDQLEVASGGTGPRYFLTAVVRGIDCLF